MDSLEVIEEKYNNILECVTNKYLYEIDYVSYFYDAVIIPAGQIEDNMKKETKIVERKQRVYAYSCNTLIYDKIMTYNDTVPKYNIKEIMVEVERFINKYELEEFERITNYHILEIKGDYILNNNIKKDYFINIVKDRQIVRLKSIKKYLQRQRRLCIKHIENLNNKLI